MCRIVDICTMNKQGIAVLKHVIVVGRPQSAIYRCAAAHKVPFWHVNDHFLKARKCSLSIVVLHIKCHFGT